MRLPNLTIHSLFRQVLQVIGEEKGSVRALLLLVGCILRRAMQRCENWPRACVRRPALPVAGYKPSGATGLPVDIGSPLYARRTVLWSLHRCLKQHYSSAVQNIPAASPHLSDETDWWIENWGTTGFLCYASQFRCYTFFFSGHDMYFSLTLFLM